MAQITVNVGSFRKSSVGGTTVYGALQNFQIPTNSGITGCTVTFTTHAATGTTADRSFSLNGSRAYSGWPSSGVSLNAGLLQAGNNTFRVTLRSTGGATDSCFWDISNITLYITYNESGGGSSPPVGGGGPVVISASAMDAGAGSVTVTCPAEAGIWHMIDWTFGSQSGSWAHSWETGGARTIEIPLSWIEEMPNETSGTLAIRVRRSNTPAMPYSYVTDQTTDVTIKVPASVVPSISNFTETLVANGVPGTISGYVQGKSKVSLAVTAAAGSYSSLASVRITGGGIDVYASSGTFGPFNYAGDIIFTATAVDTRGRSASRQVAINIMPYSAPAFSTPEAWRSNYDGVKNQKGTYVHLKSGASFSSLEEQNAVTLKGRVYLKGGEAPAWEDMALDTELILGGGALLYTRTYIAQMQVSDLLETRTIEFIIPTKKTGLSILAGTQGAAIGKPAETPGIFESAWPIVAPGLAPNPNLFHNWDFRNPVNQRGATGNYSSGGQYMFDRWCVNGGTIGALGGSIGFRISSGGSIAQEIELPDLIGKVCTVTAFTDSTMSTICQATMTFPATSGTYIDQLSGTLRFHFGNSGGNPVVFLQSVGVTTDVLMAKLELGTVSTLHLDPPMDHAVELPKCQRFFLNMGKDLVLSGGYIGTNGVCWTSLVLPNAMRVNPTIARSDGTGVTVAVISWGAEAQFSIANHYQEGHVLNIATVNTGVTTRQAVGTYVYDPGKDLYLSADL